MATVYEFNDDGYREYSTDSSTYMTAKKKEKPRAAEFTDEEKKLDAEAKSRKSVFGEVYPESRVVDWASFNLYNPQGSLGEGAAKFDVAFYNIRKEEYLFADLYGRCFVSGLHAKRVDMIRSIEGRDFIPALNTTTFIKSKFRGCGTNAYPWFEAKNGQSVIYDDKPVVVSRSQVMNSGEFFQCPIGGEWVHINCAIKIVDRLGGRLVGRQVWHKSMEKCKSYTRCDRCGTYSGPAATCVRKDSGKYCWNCAKSSWNELIHAHNHDFTIRGEPMRTPKKTYGYGVDKDGELIVLNKPQEIIDHTERTYGWEIETELIPPDNADKAIDYDNTRYGVAKRINRRLGEDGYVGIKEDGSLQLNGKYSEPFTPYSGFEIVSQPADYATHIARLEEALRANNEPKLDASCKAWEVASCGFHVHVGRAQLSRYQIGMIVLFVNAKANRSFMYAVSGRKGNAYCVYNSNRALSDAIRQERVVSEQETTSPRDRSRRVAINLSNRNTIEFRIFRGTVNIRHVMRNLAFVDAVCAFCESGVSHRDVLTPPAFINFVASNRKRWRLLYDWMVVRGFISKPKGKLGEVHEAEAMEAGDKEMRPEPGPLAAAGVAWGDVNLETPPPPRRERATRFIADNEGFPAVATQRPVDEDNALIDQLLNTPIPTRAATLAGIREAWERERADIIRQENERNAQTNNAPTGTP
jgi:hypothetical protein